MSFSFSFRLDFMSLIPILFFFFAAHCFKFMRFFLVLLEERELSFFGILFLYVRTTFVNLVIPFKLGELYRVAAVRHMTGSFKTGVSFVVIDRFFDTLSLILITLPFEIFFMKSADPVLTLLLCSLIILFLCYLFYYPSFRYLNRFIIRQKSSKRALALLEFLDRTKEWYLFLRKLIRGRGPLVIMASLLGWGMEIAALRIFFLSFGTDFEIGSFISYINSILSGGAGAISRSYNLFGSVIFLTLTVTLFIINGSKGKSIRSALP